MEREDNRGREKERQDESGRVRMGEEEIQRKIKTVEGRWPKDSNGEHQKVKRGR